METRRSLLGRTAVVGAVAVAVLAGWYVSWPRAHRTDHSSFVPPTAQSTPIGEAIPDPVLTIARIVVRGHPSEIQAWQGPGDNLCVQVEGSISCVFRPLAGQAIVVAHATWLYLDASGSGFGLFVIGSIMRRVASVRVFLSSRRWVPAEIVTLPPELGFPLRVYYLEQRTGFESLNHPLPVVAFDPHGREVGRDTYLVLGG